jgi:hypothetical protein
VCRPRRRQLSAPRWSPVRRGDYVAKVRVTLESLRLQSAENAIHHQLDLGSRPDVFGATLVDELQAHASDFDLHVQLCKDFTARPVNDATVEWPEKLSPFAGL